MTDKGFLLGEKQSKIKQNETRPKIDKNQTRVETATRIFPNRNNAINRISPTEFPRKSSKMWGQGTDRAGTFFLGCVT